MNADGGGTELRCPPPDFFRPFRALSFFDSSTQGGARYTSLALDYYLSGFQPFEIDRRDMS
jgi:hypothetical protein